jgi:hypothetical protein
MKYSDREILDVIKNLKSGEGNEDQLSYWLDNELKGIEIVLNLTFHSDEELTPEQILEKARELSKPILL